MVKRRILFVLNIRIAHHANDTALLWPAVGTAAFSFKFVRSADALETFPSEWDIVKTRKTTPFFLQVVLL